MQRRKQTQTSILAQFGMEEPKALSSTMLGMEEQSIQRQKQTRRMEQPKTVSSTDIVVFIDGSCIGNGKKSARGGYAGVFPNHKHLTFAERLDDGVTPTNNRAEYMALIRAHEVAPKGPMMVYTDSQLLYNTFTSWILKWKKNGWKKADGKPVLNLDLVKRLDAIRNERAITMQHVLAHTGKLDTLSLYNAEADRLARAASDMKPSAHRVV